MNGTVYFKDGHTEEIGMFLKQSEHNISFTTKSGFYEYRAPRFYKRILTGISYMLTGGVEAEWGYIVVPEIVKIEIPK